MSDSRSLAVLFGAAILLGALFAPWYAVELGPAARDALGSQAGQLPPAAAEFARQLVGLLPERIEANAWMAFERTDIVLLCAAIAAAFCALLGRLEIATVAGAVAAGNTVMVMVSRPGPSEFFSLGWGAWLALGGALLIVVASRLSERTEQEQFVETFRYTPLPPDEPLSPLPVLSDGSGSVAPPAR